MAEKKKLVKLTTPAGVANYAWLNKPKTKIGDKEVAPVYTVDLILPAENAAGMIEKIDAVMKEGIEGLQNDPKNKGKNCVEHYPYRMELGEDEEETGRVIFKFKMNATRKDKATDKVKNLTVDFYDTKGAAIKNPPTVYSGSIIKINTALGFNPVASVENKKNINCYLTLYINGVQLLKLSKGSSPFGDESEEYGQEEYDEFTNEGEGTENASGTKDESSDF